MVFLKGNPFFLSDEAAAWVEETIERMTTREKICQLFMDPLLNMDEGQLLEFLQTYPLGGAPFRTMPVGNERGQELIARMQQAGKIPMFFAGNNEAGANGTLRGGTLVASGSAVRATRCPEDAYQVGRISAKEIAAVGYNCNWGPVGDVLLNWRNTLINTRAYGPDAGYVSQCVAAFSRGCLENGVLPCLKHFPGDGYEERDQHLVIGYNGLSCEEWDATFGKVYTAAIAGGVPMIMAAHFILPAYQRRFNPGLKDEEMQPACTSPELIEGPLRGQLGYNGIIVTDQTMMMGYYGMRRTDALVRTIAVGCDMILGVNNMEEDYQAVLAGVEDGRISRERLHDALARILAGKAMLGLHKKEFAAKKERLACIGCPEHREAARDISDRAITLVKDKPGILPLRPEAGKKLGYVLLQKQSGSPMTLLGKGVASGGDSGVKDAIVEALTSAGFDPEELPGGRVKGVGGFTARMGERYSAVCIFADMTGFAQANHMQLEWDGPMSARYPWYVHEVPTVFISLNYTNHLHDVPRVPVFINAYNDQPETIRLVVDKLTGKSGFQGRYDDLVWCNGWDTRF